VGAKVYFVLIVGSKNRMFLCTCIQYFVLIVGSKNRMFLCTRILYFVLIVGSKNRMFLCTYVYTILCADCRLGLVLK
jgi:hypothetical protein